MNRLREIFTSLGPSMCDCDIICGTMHFMNCFVHIDQYAIIKYVISPENVWQ